MSQSLHRILTNTSARGKAQEVKVGESSRMKGVSIDGSLCHIADFKILSQADGERAWTSFVGSHEEHFRHWREL